MKKGEEIPELEKVLLLDDLCIDMRRSKSLNLSDQKVPDSLDSFLNEFL